MILISSVCSIDASTDCGIDDVNTGVDNSMCTVLYVYWVLFRNESVLILIYVVFSIDALTDGGANKGSDSAGHGGASDGMLYYTCWLLYYFEFILFSYLPLHCM